MSFTEGASVPPVDFRDQISAALAVATYKPPRTITSQTEAAAYKNYPDGYAIFCSSTGPPNQVGTVNPEHFTNLLQQTVELAWGQDALTEDRLEHIGMAVAHEHEHGKAAEELGNGLIVGHYCVDLFLAPDDKPIIYPVYYSAGVLKKVHLAWSAMAPPDSTPTDVKALHDLGYDPDDREGLRYRALAEPPLRFPTEFAQDELMLQALCAAHNRRFTFG